MRRVYVIPVLSLCFWGCTKNSDQHTQYTCNGTYAAFYRTQDSATITETGDTFSLEVEVRKTSDSIFFESTEPNANGRFLLNSEQFYQVPSISNRPYHVFKIVGDSLIMDYSWAAPVGPASGRERFTGVKK